MMASIVDRTELVNRILRELDAAPISSAELQLRIGEKLQQHTRVVIQQLLESNAIHFTADNKLSKGSSAQRIAQ